MRVASAVFGGLLLAFGLVLMVSGALGASDQTGEKSKPSAPDWECNQWSSETQYCKYFDGTGIAQVDKVTAKLAHTVAGAGFATSGAVFILIGSQPGRPRQPAPWPASGPGSFPNSR